MIRIISLEDPYAYHSEPFRASVHKELLCYYSAHYSSVLKGKSSEAKKGTIEVNLSYRQAHNFVRWLYTGTLELEETHELLYLYVFADKKEILALRRSIMSIIIEGHELEVDGSMTDLTHLSHSCGLFHYIVDLWACKWSQDGDCEDMEYYDEAKSIPRVFFYRALRKLALMVDERDTCMAALKVPCNYHEDSSVSEWEASLLISYRDPLTFLHMLTNVACHDKDFSCSKPNDDYYEQH